MRVWCLFVEMYGASPPSPIQRWVVDIYQPVVSANQVADSVRISKLKAKEIVGDMYASLNDVDSDDNVRPPGGASDGWCWRLLVCLCCCRSTFCGERSAYEQLWGDDSSSNYDDGDGSDDSDNGLLIHDLERTQ